MNVRGSNRYSHKAPNVSPSGQAAWHRHHKTRTTGATILRFGIDEDDESNRKFPLRPMTTHPGPTTDVAGFAIDEGIEHFNGGIIVAALARMARLM